MNGTIFTASRATDGNTGCYYIERMHHHGMVMDSGHFKQLKVPSAMGEAEEWKCDRLMPSIVTAAVAHYLEFNVANTMNCSALSASSNEGNSLGTWSFTSALDGRLGYDVAAGGSDQIMCASHMAIAITEEHGGVSEGIVGESVTFDDALGSSKAIVVHVSSMTGNSTRKYLGSRAWSCLYFEARSSTNFDFDLHTQQLHFPSQRAYAIAAKHECEHLIQNDLMNGTTVRMQESPGALDCGPTMWGANTTHASTVVGSHSVSVGSWSSATIDNHICIDETLL